jgi:protein-disulfide isomerase
MKLLAAAVMALAVAACSGQTATRVPDSVDKMPRGDVEAIVKDYLIKNPEVIIESLNAFQKREEDKTAQRKKDLGVKLATEKGDFPTLGPANAKITLSVFFDYNCPHCKEAYPWIFASLDDKRHDVRVVFKEYPILHPSSVEAAKAAIAADKQGKYREMHLALMHARDLSDENIEKIAQSVGLDMARWKKDKDSTGTAQQLVRVKEQADGAELSGTPAIFLNGELLEGFNQQMAEQMMDKVRAKLKGA